MDNNIPSIRRALDELRVRFADAADRQTSDEPTRFFAGQALDAFEHLDRVMRSFEYARQHAQSAPPPRNAPGSDK